MRSRIAKAGGALGAFAVIVMAARFAMGTAPSRGGESPVLVELFTSEGCSSCPPADEIANKLGAPAIVLAHHVDYWDNLGWKDPFSSPSSTARQQSYASLGGGMYTPEVVVDGRVQMVGSREGAITQAIARFAAEPHLEVRIERTGDKVHVTVPALPAGADVMLAIVQDRATVKVPRGENAGRTLEHGAIVRDLRVLGPDLTSVVPPTEAQSVVAFVQDRSSRKILGSSKASAKR